jgi:hypothetical protein
MEMPDWDLKLWLAPAGDASGKPRACSAATAAVLASITVRKGGGLLRPFDLTTVAETTLWYMSLHATIVKYNPHLELHSASYLN